MLVDNTIYYHAVTHETAWISTGTVMWGGKHPTETGYSARIPVHYDDKEKKIYRDITFIAGLVHLHHSGSLQLFDSAELDDERFRQPQGRFGSYGYFDHTLLKPSELPSVDGHSFPTLGPSWMDLPSPAKQQQQRLAVYAARDERYRAFVKRLGDKHSQDAWHLRTGELHDCSFFLTMDYKLIRMIERLSKTAPFDKLACQPVSPEQLGARLGLVPLSPRIFSFTDASYPVREDLTMPDGKRIPHSRYRKR